MRRVKALTLLYDPDCGFCRFCRGWLERQPQLIRLSFVGQGTDEADRRFPSLGVGESAEPDELIVVDDAGGVYRGAKAYLMTLYALRKYRRLSYRLSTPTMRPLARRVFGLIAHNRGRLSRWISDDRLAAELRATIDPMAVCKTGGEAGPSDGTMGRLRAAKSGAAAR